jgi:hypothetical protein
MRTLKSFLPAAILAVTLLGAAAAPALADIQGADTFRVVGLSGAQSLPLMNGPARWAGVEVAIPFDARNLRATGVREGAWIQLSYRAENGYDFTGWVDAQNIAADEAGQPTVFRIVNVGRRQSVQLRSLDGYGVLASIPGGTSVLPACGPCQNGYCQVRYQTRRGSLEGLVDQAYLAVARPAHPGFAIYERPTPSYSPAPAAYDATYAPPPYDAPAYNPPVDDPSAYADAPVDLLSMPLLPLPPRDQIWHRERHEKHRYGY